MRVVSFNANGIRSAAKKGFFDWLAAQDADFVCIQETKAHQEQLNGLSTYFPEGFYCHYVDALKKGYSGVAIYAKQKPLNVVKVLGFEICDSEGRYLQFDYPNFSIISVYFPSGTSGDARQVIKYQFLEQFAAHLKCLKSSGRGLIVCGDYNIAHKAIDLKNWRSNQKNTGFLPEERAWMDVLFGDLGFVDAFRVFNPNPDEYTWWSNRGQAWANNVGWRIDYQVITPDFVSGLEKAWIERRHRFSDHAPLVIDYA